MVLRITVVQGAFLPIPPLLGGGVEKLWFGLGKEFARRGHRIVHISRRFRNLPRTEIIEGVEHRRVRGFDAPRSKLWYRCLDALYAFNVARQLPETDVLVTNTIFLPLLIRGTRTGRLYVHVARYPKGQMRFYRHAQRLQTVSHSVGDAIRAEVPDCAAKVKVINPYLINEAPEIDFPSTWPRLQQRILYVGRIHPEKGLELLIGAFCKFRASLGGSQARLTIVGPHEFRRGGGGEAYLARLKQLAAPAGEAIDWPGFVSAEELNRLYSQASLFVYPSLADEGESFGAAPLEAMSLGTPAIVSGLDCFRDFITPGITGFTFDHHSPSALQHLVATMSEALSDPVRLCAIAGAAYQKSREFTLEKIATQYLDDFEILCASDR
jgi:glycosyltransferase involved in cell wall biosynthesis